MTLRWDTGVPAQAWVALPVLLTCFFFASVSATLCRQLFILVTDGREKKNPKHVSVCQVRIYWIRYLTKLQYHWKDTVLWWHHGDVIREQWWKEDGSDIIGWIIFSLKWWMCAETTGVHWWMSTDKYYYYVSVYQDVSGQWKNYDVYRQEEKCFFY